MDRVSTTARNPGNLLEFKNPPAKIFLNLMVFLEIFV